MSRRASKAGAALVAVAPVFAALGDPTRLQLVARLSAEGPLSIVQLRTGTPVTRQAITKHLRALAGAGVVSDERRGRERIWQLERPRLDEVRRHLDRISQEWDDTLGRLKSFVES